MVFPKWKIWVWAFFFLLAIVIRLTVAVHDKSLPIKDAYEYDQIALHLEKGEGFRNEFGELTAFRPPLYPLFLASIYKIFGHDYQMVRIIQALLSSITVVLIAGIAYSFFGRIAGLASGFISALYPPFFAFYFSVSALISETLYMFFLVSAIFTLLIHFRKPSVLTGVVSGFLWGGAILTRPIPQILLLILPFLFLILGYSKKEIIRYFSMVIILSGMCLTPWIIRNYLVFHQFVPFSTNGGLVFYESNHPGSDGFGSDFRKTVIMAEDRLLKDEGLNEAQRSKIYFSKAVRFIISNPKEFLKLFLWKGFLYMDPYHTSEERKDRMRAINWGYVLVLLGSFFGFFCGIRNKKWRKAVLILAFIFAYFLFFHSIYHAEYRYRMPTEFILICLSGIAINHLISLIMSLQILTFWSK